MLKIIISGVNGKMGQAIVSVVSAMDDAMVVAGFDICPDAITNDFPVYAKIDDITEEADVIIDFSRPAALHSVLQYAKKHDLAAVLATTGYTANGKALIREYSQFIPLFFSANMSLGVNLLIDLCKKAADFLGESVDIEIVERHHHFKIDSPSGTAIAIADSINSCYNGEYDIINGRNGNVGARPRKEIGVHAVRGGNIVGQHSVLFIGESEVLEISHEPQSRRVFAEGSIRAAKFLSNKKPGLYSMNDIVMETRTVTGLLYSKGEAAITVCDIPYGITSTASVFDTIAALGISVDIITQTPPEDGKISLSFSLSEKDLAAATEAIHKLLPDCKVKARGALVKLTVEGVGMERQHGIAAKLFNLIAEKGLDMLLITTSETKISFLVSEDDGPLARETIKNKFNIVY